MFDQPETEKKAKKIKPGPESVEQDSKSRETNPRKSQKLVRHSSSIPVNTVTAAGSPEGARSEQSGHSGIGKSLSNNTSQGATFKRVQLPQGALQNLLIRRVQPIYPQQAQKLGVQGMVTLLTLIGVDGRVQRVSLISGNPLLAPAAMEAVKQWVYRPYTQLGEPVEVETTIVVNFTLRR